MNKVEKIKEEIRIAEIINRARENGRKKETTKRT